MRTWRCSSGPFARPWAADRSRTPGCRSGTRPITGCTPHFALGQFVHYRLIRSTWGHGHVSIKRHGDLPVGSTSLHESRKAAQYLAKYVSKSFEADETSRAQRLHRYDVAQGFQPKALRFQGRWSGEVLASAVAVMGAQPARSWSSADAEDWQGPPAVWFAWD